ncbi:secretion protein EspK [Mycobacterium sp. 050128]|uniref:secretion protein EspK n=1 Tax=Mycobacterium sp. 050128 TaxID=3096112 RepID=UPI002EDAFE2E
MSIVKPTGRYAEQMLGPNGWPQVDEDTFYDRAREFTRVMSEVTAVLEACRHEQISIFEIGVWTGGAAGAAGGELATRIDELTTLQRHLARVIAWQRDIAGAVVRAKSEIGDNVELADRQINELEKDSRLETAERTDAIETLVSATLAANVGVVSDTAEQIRAIKQTTPPASAPRILLSQLALAPVDHDSQADAPDRPASLTPARVAPATLLPSIPGVGPRPTPRLPSLPGATPASPSSAPASVPVTSAAAGRPATAMPGTSGGGPAVTKSSATHLISHGGERSKGVVSVRPSSGDPSATQAEEAAVMPGMPMAPAGPTTPAAAGGNQGSGSRPAVGQTKSAVRPAATNRAAPRQAAASRQEPAERTPDSVAVQLVSVSAARAARDAIADTTVGNAARDVKSGRLRLARRIAAALNAPVVGSTPDLGFFWLTALTIDGEIVVANSYGLAYIPDGVQLPEKVNMASADEAVPAAERARWATYPVLAVQAWARHRGSQLRAVIGTEKQLANCDPGVAKIVLNSDDIPDSGAMVGRTRLEVVDPRAADRLAATPDRDLLELLGPAPAGDPPADRRATLWIAVMQPLASQLAGRQAAHLRAMHAYAVHTQEILLNRARTTVDPAAQRHTVADWLYWNHLTGRLDHTLAEAA